MVKFGKQLKFRREALGFQREAFANLAGISVDYLADLEIRKKKPSVQVLRSVILLASCRTRAEAQSLDLSSDRVPMSAINPNHFLEHLLLSINVDPDQFRKVTWFEG